MEIMVSVLTTTYNHRPYIAKTLDSLLEQTTNFPYEIIVHDDASSDGTAEVVKEYAEKYPRRIRAILQKENQYSKGRNVYEFMRPLIRGKYIAQCEGDDFWCDKYKLQRQIHYLEKHPDCSYCFCNSYNVDLDSKVIGGQTPARETRVFSPREIIKAPEIFLATAGTVYRTKDAMEMPEEFRAGEAGDIPLRHYLMLKGYAYGFADRMCCYRMMTPGSCSDRYRQGMQKNSPKFIETNEAYIRYYQWFDQFTSGAYHEEILPNLNERLYLRYRIDADWKALHQPEYREKFKKCSRKQKLIVFVKFYFPKAVDLYRRIHYGKSVTGQKTGNT